MRIFFLVTGLIIVLMWGGALYFAPEQIEERGKTVLYWSTDANPARENQLAPFLEETPDVLIKVKPATFEATIVQSSSGVGPDLIEIYNVADLVAYAEAGILKDLTPYAKEMGFSPESTYPNLKGLFVYQGKQYSYPANVASQNLFYNKRLFREAGIAEPEDSMTWDEFMELVKPLTVRRDDGKGFKRFAMVMSRGYAVDIHLQFGATFFNEDKTRCTLDSPESIEAVQFYVDLMRKHNIIPTPAAADALSGEGGWGSGEIRWFATERAATIWGSRWMLTQFRQYPELRKQMGVVILPHPEGGQPASYAGARTPAINVNTDHPEECLEFLAYFASEEYSEVIAMGADALPPNKDYSDDPSRLINPEYPWETYQDKFVESLTYASPREVSPFIDPKIVDRLWTDTLEIVENGIKPVNQAMEDLAKQINDRIERNIQEREDLREEFEARIAARKAQEETNVAGGG